MVLTKKPVTDFNDENFIELLRAEEGVITNLKNNTVYNELAKEFARRTFDESGNYYVKKFDLEAKETLNDRYSTFGQYKLKSLLKNCKRSGIFAADLFSLQQCCQFFARG